LVAAKGKNTQEQQHKSKQPNQKRHPLVLNNPSHLTMMVAYSNTIPTRRTLAWAKQKNSKFQTETKTNSLNN